MKISERDVLQLFTSLKNAEKDYPQDMISSRRDAFTKQAAAMAVLAKAGADNVAASGTNQTVSTTSSGAAGGGSVSMGKILEIALAIAIVVEAGVAAYAYREEIADFFNSLFIPKTEQVVNQAGNTVSGPEVNEDAPVIAVPATGTPTVTVMETPTPSEFTNPETTTNGNISGDTQVSSTQVPANDSNGLHLGQTKQPNKNDSNGSNNNKDNKK